MNFIPWGLRRLPSRTAASNLCFLAAGNLGWLASNLGWLAGLLSRLASRLASRLVSRHTRDLLGLLAILVAKF